MIDNSGAGYSIALCEHRLRLLQRPLGCFREILPQFHRRDRQQNGITNRLDQPHR